jgi:RNA polymerase sigma factor (sigma-70 family)
MSLKKKPSSSDEKDTVQLFYKNMYQIIGDLQIDYKDQSKLFNKMFDLEAKIRDELISSDDGRAVYDKFMNYIMYDVGNMLSARVYFRERQEKFSKDLSIAFKDSRPELLYDLRINYLFAKWAIDNYDGKRRKLQRMLEQLLKVRTQLIEVNLPLVVHRVKLYWYKVSGKVETPYMDLVQVSAEGLIQAVDKFEPPYKYIFGVTATYRMTGNMMEETSSTSLKFSPKERRIVSRAKRAVTKGNAKTQEQVADYVRESFKGTTTKKVNELMEANQSIFSLDRKVDEGSDLTFGDLMQSPDDSPDETAEKNANMVKLERSMDVLTVLQRKIIKLKVGG